MHLLFSEDIVHVGIEATEIMLRGSLHPVLEGDTRAFDDTRHGLHGYLHRLSAKQHRRHEAQGCAKGSTS